MSSCSANEHLSREMCDFISRIDSFSSAGRQPQQMRNTLARLPDRRVHLRTFIKSSPAACRLVQPVFKLNVKLSQAVGKADGGMSFVLFFVNLCVLFSYLS